MNLCRQRLPNGQIANVVGKKCIGATDDVVTLTACDGGSVWETQGNGTESLVNFMMFCCKYSLRVSRPVEVRPCR